MKLFQKWKVTLEAKFRWESTSCKALRGGGFGKNIWKENNELQENFFFFFSPSIAKFSKYFAHTQSYPSGEKKRISFFSEQSLGNCEKLYILSPWPR